MNFFTLKPFWILSPLAQIAIITVLFLIAVFEYYKEYAETGKMAKYYPVRMSILFAPIHEEVIFRGLILGGLMTMYSPTIALIISSVLFGVWHIKNVFYQPAKVTVYQVLYTGLIVGPVLALLTFWTGTIWPAVILHYLNNIFVPYSQRLLSHGSTLI